MKFPGREYEQDTTVNVLLLRRVNRVVRLDKIEGNRQVRRYEDSFDSGTCPGGNQ